MVAMKASEHVRTVMESLDQIRKLSGSERTQATYMLYHLFKKIQGGVWVVAPLYPDTDLMTAAVEAYRKNLKPTDILDDDAGPFVMDI